jgi:Tfp pilus assembly protein PilX
VDFDFGGLFDQREELMRRGSALLLVTLFGTLILLTGLGLVAVTSRFSRDSYALNRQIVCRYAAEACLQDIMHRIAREAAVDREGWFASARTRPDPVLTETIAALPGTHCSDTPTVRVSILDAGEAHSRYGTVLGADDYIVEARATLDAHSCALHMRVRYRIETTGTSSADPSVLFSRYLLWTRTRTLADGEWMTNEAVDLVGRYEGFVHVEGDVVVPKYTIMALPLTCTGRLLHPTPSGEEEEPNSYSIRTWDYNLNEQIDTTPRPEFLNLSEAEVKSRSGGGRPSVPQPDYGQVEDRFLSAALAQTSADSSLAPLWIDRANPLYAAGGAMDVGTIARCEVKFIHDNSGGRTTARIAVFGATAKGGEVSRTADVVLPPGDPLVLLSSVPISSLSGNYYANLTVASTYAGPPTEISQFGPYNDAPHNLPRLTVLGTPAVKITDHLINVDQAGRPKFWIHATGNPYPATSRLNLTGIPVNEVDGQNVDTNTTAWTAYWLGDRWDVNGWLFKKNPEYNAQATSVLGIYSRGDTMISQSAQNFIGMWAYYGGDSRSRIYADPARRGINGAHAGSTVTPQKEWYGYFASREGYEPWARGIGLGFHNYDYDLLTNPPPYWIAPTNATATASVQITASFGSIQQANR